MFLKMIRTHNYLNSEIALKKIMHLSTRKKYKKYPKTIQHNHKYHTYKKEDNAGKIESIQTF